MRTTVTMENDVAAAVAELRRERGLGVSAAVNELIRRGLQRQASPRRFEQQTSSMSARIDVTDVGEALDFLEGPTAR